MLKLNQRHVFVSHISWFNMYLHNINYGLHITWIIQTASLTFKSSLITFVFRILDKNRPLNNIVLCCGFEDNSRVSFYLSEPWKIVKSTYTHPRYNFCCIVARIYDHNNTVCERHKKDVFASFVLGLMDFIDVIGCL